MKNREKYAEQIKNFNGNSFCIKFIQPIVLNSCNCRNIHSCEQCRMIQMLWLEEEYVEQDELEQKIDWSRVKVDTLCIVKDNNDCNSKWNKRFFAGVMNGNKYFFIAGKKSNVTKEVSNWLYAKLPDGVKPEDVYVKDGK